MKAALVALVTLLLARSPADTPTPAEIAGARVAEQTVLENGRELFRDDFDGDLREWVVEQMPGGTVVVKNGALLIEDAGGCTVWFRRKLAAPVVISYEATVVSRGGAHDRVSDLNCFWMARDPKAGDGCPFAPGRGRSGRFSDYDSLLTHYVGFGGNDNSTTRYRRYDGTAARPLLPEHDLRDARFLLEPNKAYRIRLVARDGVAEFWRDGERLFEYRDSAPLREGWFAFRTVRSHLEIRRFRVERPAGLATPSQDEHPLARREAAPRTFLLSGPALLAASSSLRGGDPELRPALRKLLAEADEALRLKPVSVMDKPRAAASGDKHDYFSYGPYWWPDPTKPDGLPYIRRDGERNPASLENTDDAAFSILGPAVETLGLAYWFSGDERHARQAATLVRVWFLDAATRMNPNFQHAQAIPGISDGRGTGLIEARRLIDVNEGLALLAGSSAWTEADRAAFEDWLTAFYGWLTSSRNGRDERVAENNHGSWYDAQVAHLALVLGRTADAKAVLSEGRTLRLARQVEPDGSQPRELARTKSLGYSIFNLEALFACARLAEHVGGDWWSFATADGRSLRAALAYLAPYVDPSRAWPRNDLHPGDRTRLIPLLAQFLGRQDAADLRALYARSTATANPAARWRLTLFDASVRSRPKGPAR
jgi:hypothetical protein